ncbi:MAG: hypothetical protein IAE79_26420 [Anaerolinea sp.]|nr:hypothetical protein [Anaerolinea sp.]
MMRRMVSDTGKLRQPTHYQAYLVRLWRENETAPWRVMVTDVPTGAQRHFASLDACFVFIQRDLDTAVIAKETDREFKDGKNPTT